MRSVVGTHEEVGDFETIESLCAAVPQAHRCEIAAVCRTLRKYLFVSSRLAAMRLRADMNTRAAKNNFDAWYTEKSSQFGEQSFQCGMTSSPLSVARRAAPHTLLFFVIQALQRMLHQFWDTAQQKAYVLRCGRANGRCPPSIIAVLLYYECRELSPCMSGKTLRTKKQRLEAGSETVASS